MARVAGLPNVVLGDNQDLTLNLTVSGFDTSALWAQINVVLDDGSTWNVKTVDQEPGSPLTLANNILSGTIALDYTGSNDRSWKAIGPGNYDWNIDFLRADGTSEFRLQDRLTIAADTGPVAVPTPSDQRLSIGLTGAGLQATVTVGGWDEPRIVAIENRNATQDDRLTALETRMTAAEQNIVTNANAIDFNASEITRVENKKNAPVQILHGADFTDQNFVALNQALLVKFGAPQDNEYCTLEADGKITFKQNMYVRADLALLFTRTTGAGVAYTKIRMLINGTSPVDGHSLAIMDSQVSNTTIFRTPPPLESEVQAGDFVQVELYQDSQGNLSGGLQTEDWPGLPWPPSPSAMIDLYAHF